MQLHQLPSLHLQPNQKQEFLQRLAQIFQELLHPQFECRMPCCVSRENVLVRQLNPEQ